MRNFFLLLAVNLVALGAGVGLAGSQADTFLEQAQTRYAELDFEAAIPFLDKAYAQLGNTRFQLVRIYHLWGLCLGSLGKYDLARDVFARLLALDPSFRLGSDVSPRVSSPFNDLLKTNPPRLDVQVVPPQFAELGKPLSLNAKVVSDPVKLARVARVFFRCGNLGRFSSIKVVLGGAGMYPITIPNPSWQIGNSQGPLFWYAVVENEHQGHLLDIGEEARPLSLEVLDRPPPAIAGATEETRWYERWWVWALIGAAVAGGTTAAVLVATTKPTGPFDFTVDFR